MAGEMGPSLSRIADGRNNTKPMADSNGTAAPPDHGDWLPPETTGHCDLKGEYPGSERATKRRCLGNPIEPGEDNTTTIPVSLRRDHHDQKPRTREGTIPDSDACSDEAEAEAVDGAGNNESTGKGSASKEEEETPPRTEPVLCPEQAKIVELIESGRNVFYTGSAGCGKSTVLRAFVKRMQDRGMTVDIVAPTGIAALEVGGSTTYTYAGWNPDSFKLGVAELRKAARKRFVRRRLRSTDVLVIDEISMVENWHLERLSAIMCEARGVPEPFGGAQVVITGDFFQLPPVKPFQYCLQCGFELRVDQAEESYTCPNGDGTWFDEDKWAFQSAVWKQANLEHVHLTTIHRQAGDVAFIRLLQKCRLSQPLNSHEIGLLCDDTILNANGAGENKGARVKKQIGQATKLFSTREEVRRVNAENFARLTSPIRAYPCRDNFRWNSELHPHLERRKRRYPDGSLQALEDHRYERRLELKLGMLVVLLANVDLAQGLCNGSQGIVCGFEPVDDARLPKAATLRRAAAKPEEVDSSNPFFRPQSHDNPLYSDQDGDRNDHALLKEREIREFAASLCHSPPAPPPSQPAGPFLPPSSPTSGSKNTGEQKKTETPSHVRLWPVVKFHPTARFPTGITRTIIADCAIHQIGDRRPFSILSRAQVPLAPAWAMSIHKSQSLTLSRVVVDLSRAFEKGQAYVALSRATNLAGLKVVGNVTRALGAEGGKGGWVKTEVKEETKEAYDDDDGNDGCIKSEQDDEPKAKWRVTQGPNSEVYRFYRDKFPRGCLQVDE